MPDRQQQGAKHRQWGPALLAFRGRIDAGQLTINIGPVDQPRDLIQRSRAGLIACDASKLFLPDPPARHGIPPIAVGVAANQIESLSFKRVRTQVS